MNNNAPPATRIEELKSRFVQSEIGNASRPESRPLITRSNDGYFVEAPHALNQKTDVEIGADGILKLLSPLPAWMKPGRQDFDHAGIIVCTVIYDAIRLVGQIHAALVNTGVLSRQLAGVTRGNWANEPYHPGMTGRNPDSAPVQDDVQIHFKTWNRSGNRHLVQAD